jgi:hypothetical protein
MSYNVSYMIPGLLTGWVDNDYLIGPFPGNTDITQWSPSLTDAPNDGGGTGNLNVSLRNAAAGAGDSIDIVFADGESNQNEVATITVLGGGYAYIRVTSESGFPMGLGGFFVAQDASPIGDFSSEPLTLGEVKHHLGIQVTKTEHDTDLGNLITRTRADAERLCGIPIIDQAITYTLDKFPSGRAGDWWDGEREGALGADEANELELPPGNLQSVTSVTTYDDADAGTVFSSDNYFADLVTNRIVLRSGQAWPYVARVANGIVIVLQMGWPDQASVPQDLKERIKEHIALRWHHRNDMKEVQVHSDFYGTWVRRRVGARNA